MYSLVRDRACTQVARRGPQDLRSSHGGALKTSARGVVCALLARSGMRTSPSLLLIALVWAGAGCATDPGTKGSGSASGGASYSDGSGPPAYDATLSDTGVSQPPPDGSARLEAEAPGPDASPSDAPDTLEAGTPGDDASDGAPGPQFNVLAIGHLINPDGSDDIHAPFVRAATAWLTALAAQKNFTFTSVVDPNSITDDVLTPYNLVLQLNYTPFDWNPTAQAAFEKYLTDGRGGWVGLHHAALYGPEVQPASEPPWTWFYDFIGQINFLDYIATFAAAEVYVEEPTHPIFAGVPSPFLVTTDEWYTWDRSPRPNVHVLAHVDENSYMPPSDIKMGGDHPVIWTNDAYKGRNLYIFIGHHHNLFQNAAYMTLLENAIFWAAGQPSP
jgi:type 1 glutamine amidotransferase